MGGEGAACCVGGCVTSGLAHISEVVAVSQAPVGHKGGKILQGYVLAELVFRMGVRAVLLGGMQELGEDGFPCPC